MDELYPLKYYAFANISTKYINNCKKIKLQPAWEGVG